MRILITGGAGFIGSYLSRMALGRGHDVQILDDFSTGYVENIPEHAQLIRGSVQDPSSASRAVNGMDSIIHLGALGSVPRSIKDPFASHDANATGTLVLLEAARSAGVSQVISASSSSVYGRNPALPKSEREWTRPMSPYAVTKLATEQYTLCYQESFGLKTLAFRFFNVFGPGQRAGHAYAAVVPTWIDAILRGDPLWINGDGTNSRDFTYVGTVCEVLLAAVEQRTSHPEPVNLAFGTNTTLLELIQQLTVIHGDDLDVQFREPRPGDVPHSQADNTTLRRLFPSITPMPLEAGLEETYRWFTSPLGP